MRFFIWGTVDKQVRTRDTLCWRQVEGICRADSKNGDKYLKMEDPGRTSSDLKTCLVGTGSHQVHKRRSLLKVGRLVQAGNGYQAPGQPSRVRNNSNRNPTTTGGQDDPNLLIQRDGGSHDIPLRQLTRHNTVNWGVLEAQRIGFDTDAFADNSPRKSLKRDRKGRRTVAHTNSSMEELLISLKELRKEDLI